MTTTVFTLLNKTNNINSSNLTTLGVESCGVQDAATATSIYLTFLVNQILIAFVVNNALVLITALMLIKKSDLNDQAVVRERKLTVNSIALDLACFVCKAPLLIALACSPPSPLAASSYSSASVDQLTGPLFAVCLCLYTVESAHTFVTNCVVNSGFSGELSAACVCALQCGKSGSAVVTVSDEARRRWWWVQKKRRESVGRRGRDARAAVVVAVNQLETVV
jgi:hypothetical protein